MIEIEFSQSQNYFYSNNLLLEYQSVICFKIFWAILRIQLFYLLVKKIQFEKSFQQYNRKLWEIKLTQTEKKFSSKLNDYINYSTKFCIFSLFIVTILAYNVSNDPDEYELNCC